MTSYREEVEEIILSDQCTNKGGDLQFEEFLTSKTDERSNCLQTTDRFTAHVSSLKYA